MISAFPLSFMNISLGSPCADNQLALEELGLGASVIQSLTRSYCYYCIHAVDSVYYTEFRILGPCHPLQ